MQVFRVVSKGFRKLPDPGSKHPCALKAIRFLSWLKALFFWCKVWGWWRLHEVPVPGEPPLHPVHQDP